MKLISGIAASGISGNSFRGDGITGHFIRYSQIKSLLRPNTVVSQYIK